MGEKLRMTSTTAILMENCKTPIPHKQRNDKNHQRTKETEIEIKTLKLITWLPATCSLFQSTLCYSFDTRFSNTYWMILKRNWIYISIEWKCSPYTCFHSRFQCNVYSWAVLSCAVFFRFILMLMLCYCWYCVDIAQ